MEEKKKRWQQINPFLIGGVFFAVIAIILIIVTIINLFHVNQYGKAIIIDNFSSYFGGVPREKRDQIEHELYENVVFNGVDIGDIPNSGALVREGTTTYVYEEKDDLYRGEFIVDIDVLKQSYEISFVNPSGRSPANDVSYQVIITCVPGTKQIYEFYNCRDMFSDNVSWGNEYQLDYALGTNTSYRIRQILNEPILGIETENHVAIIDETSMTRIMGVSDNQYKFSVDVDGKYKVLVTVRTDFLFGEEYIAVFADVDGKKSGYLWNTNEGMKDELADWIIDQSGMQELDITFIPVQNS